MSPQDSHTLSIKKAYNTTVKSFKNNPALFVPFIIFAILEFISLIIIYLAPRMPLRLIFGPPIRTFWGERFLHYPLNFLLLPKLTSLARMGLTILLGSLLTGMAVAITLDIYNKKQIKLAASFKTAFKKYIYLFSVVFLFTLLFCLLVKIVTIVLIKYFIAGQSRLLFLGPGIWLGPILLIINFLLALFVQSAFIYTIPFIIIEKEKLIKAIIKSFVLFKKLFVPTLILVGLPMLLYIPVIILQYKGAILMNRLFPEFVLLLSVLGVIISSLVIDPLVTISTTFLYLLNKEKI
jgi:hypothetical protein